MTHFYLKPDTVGCYCVSLMEETHYKDSCVSSLLTVNR